MDIKTSVLVLLVIVHRRGDACNEDAKAVDMCKETTVMFEGRTFLSTSRSPLEAVGCLCRITARDTKLIATIADVEADGCSSRLEMIGSEQNVTSNCENRNRGRKLRSIRSVVIIVRRRLDNTDEYCIDVSATGKAKLECKVLYNQQVTDSVYNVTDELPTDVPTTVSITNSTTPAPETLQTETSSTISPTITTTETSTIHTSTLTATEESTAPSTTLLPTASTIPTTQPSSTNQATSTTEHRETNTTSVDTTSVSSTTNGTTEITTTTTTPAASVTTQNLTTSTETPTANQTTTSTTSLPTETQSTATAPTTTNSTTHDTMSTSEIRTTATLTDVTSTATATSTATTSTNESTEQRTALDKTTKATQTPTLTSATTTSMTDSTTNPIITHAQTDASSAKQSLTTVTLGETSTALIESTFTETSPPPETESISLTFPNTTFTEIKSTTTAPSTTTQEAVSTNQHETTPTEPPNTITSKSTTETLQTEPSVSISTDVTSINPRETTVERTTTPIIMTVTTSENRFTTTTTMPTRQSTSITTEQTTHSPGTTTTADKTTNFLTTITTTDQKPTEFLNGYQRCIRQNRAFDICAVNNIVENKIVLHTSDTALDERFCSCDVMSGSNVSVAVYIKSVPPTCTSSIVLQKQEDMHNVFCKETVFYVNAANMGRINTIMLEFYKEVSTRAEYCIEISNTNELPITASCGQKKDSNNNKPKDTCLKIAIGYGSADEYVAVLNETMLGGQRNSSEVCPVDDSPLISGKCEGDSSTGTYWVVRMSNKCDFTDMKSSENTAQLVKLSQISATSTVAEEILEEVSRMTKNPSSLTPKDIIYIADILWNAVKRAPITTKAAELAISIVNDILSVNSEILLEAQRKGAASERILKAVDVIGSVTEIGNEDSWQTVHPNIALNVWQLSTKSSLTLGLVLTSDSESDTGDVELIDDQHLASINEGSKLNLATVDAAIFLPNTFIIGQLYKEPSDGINVSMHIYSNGKLFMREHSTVEDVGRNETPYGYNSKVVGCSLWDARGSITYFGGEFVTIVLLPNEKTENPICGYWQHSDKNVSVGLWKTDGCHYNGTFGGRHMCSFNHLTNFAVLMDFNRNDPLSEKDQHILSLITMIGLAVSTLALFFTIMSFILFRKLREGRSQKVLFQLSLALISSWVVFLVGINQTQDSTGCLVVAALLHYFLLVAFMWMCVEAVVQYHRFVKVLGTYVPNFVLKAAIVSWGLPLVPVAVLSAIDHYLYRSEADYCWMSQEAFYYAFAPPVGIMVAFNVIVYYIVVSKICWRQTDIKSTQDQTSLHLLNIRAAISVFVLLGLTWVFGFLTVTNGKVIFSYIFTILTVLQGLHIFILFTLRDNQFRMEWMRVCCPGRYRRRQRLSLTSSILLKRSSQKGCQLKMMYMNDGFRTDRIPSD